MEAHLGWKRRADRLSRLHCERQYHSFKV